MIGKAIGHDVAGGAPAGQEEALVRTFLTSHGWLPGDSTTLVLGVGAVQRFEVPGCNGRVRVGLLPLSGEMDSLFAQTAGAGHRVLYVYRGRTFADPPRLAYLHAKLARLTEKLGLPRPSDRPVVAISHPPTCRLDSALPWSEL